MSLDITLSRLSNVRKTSNGWQACCPAHEDKKASLSISLKDGHILLYCHAGCSIEEILETIGLEKKDLFIEERNRKPEIAATYEYTDENGKLLFQTLRFYPKDFRQRRPDGQGDWFWNLKNTRLVPYHLPEIIKSASIIIVEGEKDVDNLRKIGFSATCNPMGAGKWKTEWSKFFEGKEIFIIPDLDEPGQKHALDVGKKLFDSASRIKIIQLPKESNIKDISDWLAKNHTKEELFQLISKAKEWSPHSNNSKKSTSEANENTFDISKEE